MRLKVFLLKLSHNSMSGGKKGIRVRMIILVTVYFSIEIYGILASWNQMVPILPLKRGGKGG